MYDVCASINSLYVPFNVSPDFVSCSSVVFLPTNSDPGAAEKLLQPMAAHALSYFCSYGIVGWSKM